MSASTTGIGNPLSRPAAMAPVITGWGISSGEETVIGGGLVRMIREGLAEAGIPTGNRRHGLILIGSLARPVGVGVRPYAEGAPVWRITFGMPEPRPWPGLVDPCELTLHLCEFGERTGVDLARLLREPGWRWPLFGHEPAFPRYAWSRLARETWEVHRPRIGAAGRRRMERSASL